MKDIVVRWAAFGLLGLLVSCTTPGPKGTDVTRFHLDKPIAPQPVNIEAADNNAADSLAFSSYSNIIAAELKKIGLEQTPGDSAALIAVVSVTRSMQQAPPKRSAFSIGVGGGSYGSGGGMGAGVNMPVGGGNSYDGVFVTTLEVKLVERDSNTVMWEGSAIRSTPSGTGNATDVVQQLATALFRDFPGKSGETITVE
jgi:hypothetical protein